MQEELLGIIEEDGMVERSVKRCERWLRDIHITDPERYRKEFGLIMPNQILLRLHSIRYILSAFTEDTCKETIRVSLSVGVSGQTSIQGRFNCDFNLYGGMDNSGYKKENTSSVR